MVTVGIKPVMLRKDGHIKMDHLMPYMSPCPRRPLPWRPVGRRICRWLLWSFRYSPAPWWYEGEACGRGRPRSELPLLLLSGDSRASWTSLGPAMAPRPLWKNLTGGYSGTEWMTWTNNSDQDLSIHSRGLQATPFMLYSIVYCTIH